GYFSKPPLIAWIIRATTLFGDREWAIRLASPILHAGTALLLFSIGRRVIDTRTGFWSGFAYATLPGVSYSSALISTDVPLLFCWSLALYAFLTALEDRRWRWSILCGLAIGLGLLAKYAMIYFLLGAAVATVFVPGARNLMVSARGLAIPILGLAILSPNLIWNAAHGFPTFSHMEANANWGHARYSVISAVEFVLGQFGVFGPIMMASFVVAIWRLQRRAERDDGRVVLAAFCLPILALVIIQSFISDANANWAAVAYVGAIPLAVSRFLQWLSGRALW